jgi:hypothetical protein
LITKTEAEVEKIIAFFTTLNIHQHR